MDYRPSEAMCKKKVEEYKTISAEVPKCYKQTIENCLIERTEGQKADGQMGGETMTIRNWTKSQW